jgi:exportin-2 (importin alpha re-exporter)
MEQVKAQICENITMYAQKYDEEFSSHLPGFVTTVWNLLINTGSDVKYDQVSFQERFI